MSLRLRLLLGVLTLAAAGLVVFGLVSYRSLDDYLSDRADDQVRAALDPVAQVLTAPGNVPGVPGGAVPLAPPGAVEPAPGPSVPGPPPASLPPGTFGQLRDEDGNVVEEILFSYGQPGFAEPALPGSIEGSRAGEELDFQTVEATGDAETEFRVAALTEPSGETVVAAVPLGEAESTLDRLAASEAIVAGVILAALAGLGWWVVGVGLRPLERMGDTATAIAAGDLSRRVEPADTSTEVGRLGLALNAMLEQIEASFAERQASEQRMRQFLADASHELRTPLASVRGYSELLRMGAAADPAEIDKAMARIEDESARMGVLVDDLLTLARLDEVREPERAPVEVGEVVSRVSEDARLRSPDRPISVQVPGEETWVEGEREMLLRLFSNLLRNAEAHTPPGTPVEVALSSEAGKASVTVRDHGTGFGDVDPAALFERFRRDSASRNRASGGAGLGLAIVAAVAADHGGEVTAANAPGGGAVFTVSLPLCDASG
jgi:two-component system OmpR family sensor kinase